MDVFALRMILDSIDTARDRESRQIVMKRSQWVQIGEACVTRAGVLPVVVIVVEGIGAITKAKLNVASKAGLMLEVDGRTGRRDEEVPTIRERIYIAYVTDGEGDEVDMSDGASATMCGSVVSA